MLKDITLENFNIDKISDLLRTYGIAIVKNYLALDKVERIKGEIINTSDNELSVTQRKKHISNKDGEIIIFNSAKLGDNHEQLKTTFLSADFRKLTEQYFQSKNIGLNSQIYFTHELHDDNPILPWHFDRTQALKFYINLIDVDASNGAFGYCLKSHREGNLRANYHIFKGMPIQNIPNDVPDHELYNDTIIEAKAGDLIIFDAAGFHSGGTVEKDKERMVIRGHSHPPNVHLYGQAKRFSPEWFIQSPLNVVKRFAKNIERKPTISDSQASLTRKR